MKIQKIYLLLLTLVALLFSCGNEDGTHISNDPGETEDVLLIASDTVAVFERPDAESKKWHELSPGESVVIVGKTADGWLGYDPADPMTENLGALRIRWIAPNGKYILQGDSSYLSEIWHPQIQFTYAITSVETYLLENPKANADELLVLPSGTVAAITRMDGEWFEIDLGEGTSALDGTGWVKSSDCELFGDMSVVPMAEEPPE